MLAPIGKLISHQPGVQRGVSRISRDWLAVTPRVSYFFHCCDDTPERNKKWEGFNLAHGSSVRVCRECVAWRLVPRQPWWLLVLGTNKVYPLPPVSLKFYSLPEPLPSGVQEF